MHHFVHKNNTYARMSSPLLFPHTVKANVVLLRPPEAPLFAMLVRVPSSRSPLPTSTTTCPRRACCGT
eukprot:9148846-Pyramimonas_sp.AAC.3